MPSYDARADKARALEGGGGKLSILLARLVESNICEASYRGPGVEVVRKAGLPTRRFRRNGGGFYSKIGWKQRKRGVIETRGTDYNKVVNDTMKRINNQ